MPGAPNNCPGLPPGSGYFCTPVTCPAACPQQFGMTVNICEYDDTPNAFECGIYNFKSDCEHTDEDTNVGPGDDCTWFTKFSGDTGKCISRRQAECLTWQRGDPSVMVGEKGRVTLPAGVPINTVNYVLARHSYCTWYESFIERVESFVGRLPSIPNIRAADWGCSTFAAYDAHNYIELAIAAIIRDCQRVVLTGNTEKAYSSCSTTNGVTSCTLSGGNPISYYVAKLNGEVTLAP
jgi:hypothetical protein